MPKIKRLINCTMPVSACNFKCSYCYVPKLGARKNLIPPFEYDLEFIGKAFSKKRLGGTCLFNICAIGETMLPKEIVGIIEILLKQGHYLEVVTNGTLTSKFEEVAKLDPKLLKRLEFKFSFHYLELLKHGLLDTFFNNVDLIKKQGCSFTVELMPHDELVPYIEDIKKVCLERVGALCQLTVGRNENVNMRILSNMSKLAYEKIWSVFDSPMFKFKLSTFNVKRKEYCYAGDWLLNVNLYTGEAQQCYCSEFKQNIYKDINKKIVFVPIGNKCSLPHCFNSHAMLTLGMIPEIKGPTYADIRNRECLDHSEWLQPVFKKFISGRFEDNNKQYSNIEKYFNKFKIIRMKIMNVFQDYFKKRG